MERMVFFLCVAFIGQIKKQPWPFDRTAAQIGRIDRPECCEKGGRDREPPWCQPPGQTCKIFSGKPRPCGDTQITRYELKQDVRVSQEEARYSGLGSV